MQSQIPPRFTFFTVGKIRIYAAVWDGPEDEPPLVMQHGLWDTWESFAEVAPRLAQHRTVIATELRGHGRSDRPAHGYTLNAYADDLSGIMGQLKAPRVDLLGHSLGGAVGIVLAARREPLLRRLVLEDPPLPSIADVAQLSSWFRTLLALKRVPIEQVCNELAPLHLGLDPAFTERSARALVETADGPFQSLIDEPGLLLPWPELLSTVTVPTLFLAPDPESGAHLERVRTLVTRALTGVRFIEVENAGHHIHAYAADAFVRQVDEFLRPGE